MASASVQLGNADPIKDQYADFETEMAVVFKEGRSVHLSIFLN